MKTLWLVLACLLVLPVAADAANIIIVNNDGPNEGFNDNTPAAPVGGNTGTTIGAQRLILFQEAADIWGGLISSPVTIRVQAQFNPLTCDASSAVLGSAGPIQIFRDFGQGLASTWYHAALANQLAGSDLSAGTDDISATFNSSIDNNPNCLPNNWYYGLDGNEGSDTELLPVLLHELGHGLGFSTFVNSSGQEFGGFQDIYETFLYDNTAGLHWNAMNDAQRAASAINPEKVAFDGPKAVAGAQTYLGPLPELQISSPPLLAGDYDIGLASFGPSVTLGGVSGNIVLIQDDTIPFGDGCETIVNAAALNGNIVLIDRGSCSFVAKAQAAEAAGAIAVIIANNVSGSTPITLGGAGVVNIPTVSVTQNTGALIKSQLGSGVFGSILLDPTELAGADASGRPLVYTPNPYNGGSSVSHWDVSASPNLLMEPFISGSLSNTVDLTLPHFEDIGWVLDATTAVRDETPSPAGILGAAYPNPFQASTRISFDLPREGHATLEVFDLAGRLVDRLIDGPLEARTHDVTWDGTNASGRSVSSGVYLYRLTAGDVTEVRRMVLMN